MTAANATILLELDQARILEHVEMLGHGGQRDIVGIDQFADALRSIGYLSEDVPTNRVCQRVEYRVEIQVVRRLFNQPV